MIDFILDHWIEIFTDVMKDDADALKMKIIKKAPSQLDPVRDAPYLVIGYNTDPEKGVHPEGPGEIGGSTCWVAELRIKAAPKSQKDLTRTYYLVDLLTQRIVWILRKYSLVQVAAAQGTGELQNLDWFTVRRITPKVTGGDGEWLGYVEIDFIQRFRELGPFPYGAYPGDID